MRSRWRLMYGVTNSPAFPGMRTQTLRCRTFRVKTGTVLSKMGWLVTEPVQPVLSHKHPRYVLYIRLRWESGCPAQESGAPLPHTHPPQLGPGELPRGRGGGKERKPRCGLEKISPHLALGSILPLSLTGFLRGLTPKF